MFDFLINANIAYVLLMLGFLMAVLAILTPGTTVLEVSAFFALLLAGYATYNLPINLWALAVLVLGTIPFFLAVRKSGERIYLGLSLLSLVVGSIFLFRGEQWWQPAVHPLLGIAGSALTGGFLWLVTVKVLEAERLRPSHDLEALIGAVGITQTEVHAEGSVQVAGELWSASSAKPIPAGTEVRVIARQGLLLEVEALQDQTENPN